MFFFALGAAKNVQVISRQGSHASDLPKCLALLTAIEKGDLDSLIREIKLDILLIEAKSGKTRTSHLKMWNKHIYIP